MSSPRPKGDRGPMRVATITTFFPHAADRYRAVFVENLVRAMGRRCPIDVISPLPFAPPLRAFPAWYQQSQIPRREVIDGIEVEHPRYVVMPKLELASGLTYAAGVLPTLRRLGREASDLVLHAHCAFPDGVGVALAARRLGLPYAITAHGSDINVYAERQTLAWQIRWALAGAGAIIAVSGALSSKISRLLGAAAADAPLHHIPCAGYDPTVFFPRAGAELRSELNLRPEARLVIFVGQLVPIKGVDRLIEAWRLLQADGRCGPADRLIVIGEGKCADELGRQAAGANLSDTVIFAGGKPQATVARWIAGANVLCLSSHNEGTPNVIVEAFASGVPVVAFQVGGISELIQPDVNGLLVPAGDTPALAAAIAATLGRTWDPDRIRQTVARSTWDAIADATIDVLSKVSGRRHASLA
jgi:teichuronic acid biosynthesis glycosyltransferase TuaC